MLAITDLRAHPYKNIPRCLTVIFLVCSCAAFTSTPQASAVLRHEYTAAIAQKEPADRIRDLELFALTASGPLKTDAFEVVVWEYMRAGNIARAFTWANELNATDKGNALASAAICQAAQHSSQVRLKKHELREIANQGTNALPRLRHPAGMSDVEFSALRRQVSLILETAGGSAGSQQRDYSSASSDQHRATTVDSNSAQSMYRTAMADLGGKNSNRKQGFWELARAVVLSRGTVRGRQMAEEARKRYLKDGGTNAGWDQFLEAAAAGNPSLVPSARFASLQPVPTLSSTSAKRPTQVSRRPQPTSLKAVTTSAKANRTQVSGEQVWADSKAASPGIIRRHRVTTGPMSLGILVETSLTGNGRRGAVANALIDMLRHMSDDDEAFILTYDNQMVFEQDLTNDPKQLDQAMQDIRPRNGARLDEAVTFAAGHLARIAKNPNRILLVISDGRNVDDHTSLRTSGLISATGVRIYCVGIGVSTRDERSHLQALSAGTGGQSDFISDSSQFRGATKQIAHNIGIDFRF